MYIFNPLASEQGIIWRFRPAVGVTSTGRWLQIHHMPGYQQQLTLITTSVCEMALLLWRFSIEKYAFYTLQVLKCWLLSTNPSHTSLSATADAYQYVCLWDGFIVMAFQFEK